MQPFNLTDQKGFESWSEYKRSLYSAKQLQVLSEAVEIGVDGVFDEAQLTLFKQHIRDYNFALYRVNQAGEFNAQSIQRLSKQIGLRTLDAHLCVSEDMLSEITDRSESSESGDQRQHYIPYSDKALSWHTDGYYNPYSQRVQAFILHCQQPAASGGDNSFIDPEIVYMLLREQNPDFIKALCHTEVMRIPENRTDTTNIREETVSSVFQVSDDYLSLDMRFSQRKRHIIWRDDALTQAALQYLNQLLNQDSPWRINYRLNANEGVICNNVLHRRDAYQDDGDNPRRLLRARFYNRIALLAA